MTAPMKILCSEDFGPEGTGAAYCVFIRTPSVRDLIGLSVDAILVIDEFSNIQTGDYVVAKNDAGKIDVDADGKVSEIIPIAKADVPGYTKEAEDAWRTSNEVINWQPPADEDAEEATEAEPATDD